MKKILIFTILFLVLLGAGSGLRAWYYVGDNTGYAPTQPIPFSHKIHAGINKIPCMYCHTNVDNSKHATVPAMNVCMNCHLVVKTDSPWIKQLTELYKKNEPIQWVKVHDVPDFVFFNHKRHIKKGIPCASCHGDVQNMDKITQVQSLQMGFCMTCHKEKGAPTDCYTCHQ